MKPLQNAEFKAEFPDDATYDDTGDFEIFSGRNVSEAIKEMLERIGGKVSEPKHCFEEGWEFDACFGARRIWFRVTQIDDFHFQTLDLTGLFSRWLDKKMPAYGEILDRLNGELKRDPRFKKIEWHDASTLLSGEKGARGPLVES